VGMWMGLVHKGAGAAAMAAMARILALPWLLLAILTTAYALLDLNRFVNVESEHATFVICLVLGVGIDAAYIIWAKRRLHGRFREMAGQQRAPSKRRWWFGARSVQQGQGGGG